MEIPSVAGPAMSKSWLVTLLKVLVTLLLLTLVLQRVDYQIVFETVRSADIGLLIIPIILYFPLQLLAAYRWYFLLRQLNRGLSFWSIVRHNALGQFSGLLLPGQIGGDIVRFAAASRGQQGKAVLALSIAIDKLAFLAAVAGIGMLGAVGNGPLLQLQTVYGVILGVFGITLIAVAFLCRFRNERTAQWVFALSDRLPKLKQALAALAKWFSLPQLPIRAVALLLLLALGFQLANAVGSYVTARSMHIVVDPIDWAAINAIVALIQVLPITIGGLGIREGVFAAILALYNVPAAQAVAFSLVGFALVTVLIILSWLIIELTTDWNI